MLALIVACSKNRVIGKDGRIPFDIKEDKLRFKELTTGNIVIMGRKTIEDIGCNLPNRYTIMVSSTKKLFSHNCITVGSLQEAIEKSIEVFGDDKDIYICGGERLYKEAIDIVDRMYVTEIEAYIEGDTYFPKFDESKFERYVEKKIDGDLPYEFVIYDRK